MRKGLEKTEVGVLKRRGGQSATALEMPMSREGAQGVVAFSGEERSFDVLGGVGRDVEPEAVVSTAASGYVCGGSSRIVRGPRQLGGEVNVPEQVDPTKHLGGCHSRAPFIKYQQSKDVRKGKRRRVEGVAMWQFAERGSSSKRRRC
jgi:hypothetical protein